MRKIFITLAIIGSILIMFFSYLSVETWGSWSVPKSIVGVWIGMQKATIRFKGSDGNFKFIKSPDSINITLKINSDGIVSGSFGNSSFDNCEIKKNRGKLGEELNFFTDFIIIGKLNGSIFPADSIGNKPFSLPFNLIDSALSGSIFDKSGDGYPISNINLQKDSINIK